MSLVSEYEIQLQTESILNVPLLIYGDFTFVVNDKEFKTSKLISDLLSPKICQIHKNDPNFNKYVINTDNKGDFSYILNLVGFNQINIPINETPFICEVIELLGNESIKTKDIRDLINDENVISLINEHSKYSFFFAKSIKEEIDYISEHFYDIAESHEDQLQALSEDLLQQILMNPKLKVIDEDQVLKFVNNLYLIDTKYSPLYENVSFENVDGESIDVFLSIFNIKDLTNGIWRALSKRLSQKNKGIIKTESNGKKNLNRHPQFSNLQLNNNQQQQNQESQIQSMQPHQQPKYPPIQPHQLQQLQEQLIQQQEDELLKQYEEKLRQYEEERLENLQSQSQEQETENKKQETENIKKETENIENLNSQLNNNEHKSFSYDSNNQFSGILDYLNKESRGSIDDLITVTASSISGRSFPNNVTFLLDRNRRFCSSGVEQNPWICFDFRNYQVVPSNYTIRSCDSGYDPKSWVIEGSKDNANWIVLDEQKDCTLLKGDFKTHTFSIENSNSEQYRYLRMRLTAQNWKNDYTFIINSFEIYGTLI